MKIAVVGSGISGLTCAYLLASVHEVVLFEKDSRLGGHTHTMPVEHEGRRFSVDTGFIVFNERNYPNFCRLLGRLGVASQPTTMSFSVRDDRTGFEYGGSSLSGLIGSPANLLNPRWWGVVRGVASLGTRGKALLQTVDDSMTIGDLCRSGVFSRGLLQDYLLPMAGAIWSAPHAAIMAFPARLFLRFFDNHGMLDLRERPQWRTIVGGSCAYIQAMRPVLDPLTRTGEPVLKVARSASGVAITTPSGLHAFDAAILAAHSDQALAVLHEPSAAEREVLAEIPYQSNDVVLHTDAKLLPRRRRSWAAWNYRLLPEPQTPGRPVPVTYNMSILQRLDTREPICVTLNDTEAIDPAKIIARMEYHHPCYTIAGERARARWSEISGVDRLHYCGAYWGNGFHEDGVNSALRVCERLGVRL